MLASAGILAHRGRAHQHLAVARRALARHNRRRRAGRRRQPRARSRPRRRVRLRHVGGLPAPARVALEEARRGAGPAARHQRLDAGRRLPVPGAGRTGRRGRRRGADVRPHAAVADQAGRGDPRDPARAGRHRRGRARGRARRGCAADARPHHPELPEPRRLHALAGKARPAAGARARARLHPVRGRPLRRIALRGRAAPAHARARRGRRRRRLRVLVLEDGRPGHPGRLPRRPGGPDRRAAPTRDRDLHLAEHGRAGDRGRVLRLRRGRPLGRDRQGGAARAPRRDLRRSRPPPPRRALRDARGWLLPLGRPPGGHRRRRAGRRCRRARRFVREGHRVHDRGRGELAPTCLLRRAARPDRGGRRAHRRGIPGAARPRACVIELERPRDAGALLRDSLGVYLGHFWTFLALGALVVIPAELIVGGVGLGQLTAGYDKSPNFAEVAIPNVVSYLVVAPLITAICVYALRSVAAGGSPGAREAIVRGFESFSPIFFAVLLAALGTVLGAVLIVPGIYLFVRWYFVPQTVVLERAQGAEALR